MKSTGTGCALRPERVAAAALVLASAACAPSGVDGSGTDFEAWGKIGEARVYDRARKAPDDTRTADLLDLEAGQGFWRELPGPVPEGETFVFNVYLASRGSPEVTLQLLNYCTPDPPEVATERFTLDRQLRPYAITHTFAAPQGCVRAQLILTSVDARVTAWKPTITRTPPGAAAPAPTP